MSDFFEEKTVLGAAITQQDLADYFMREKENTLKFINFGRELLGIPPMTKEQYDEFVRT